MASDVPVLTFYFRLVPQQRFVPLAVGAAVGLIFFAVWSSITIGKAIGLNDIVSLEVTTAVMLAGIVPVMLVVGEVTNKAQAQLELARLLVPLSPEDRKAFDALVIGGRVQGMFGQKPQHEFDNDAGRKLIEFLEHSRLGEMAAHALFQRSSRGRAQYLQTALALADLSSRGEFA
ncbi:MULTISPECIES: hypothetical protein [unclassified Bradyrhizobium]